MTIIQHAKTNVNSSHFRFDVPPLSLVTWKDYGKIEPELTVIQGRVANCTTPRFTAEFWWYWSRCVKRRLIRLVGWYAQKPQLRSSEAYNVAIDYLLSVYEDRVSGD